MKLYPSVAIAKGTLSAAALLTVLGINISETLAQSCLNCWINPQTGQQESLERIIPSKTPSNPSPPPVTSSPPTGEAVKPEDEGKSGNSPPDPSKVPVLDDPIDRLDKEPQPVPRTQIDPRLRYQEQEQKLEEN